MVGLEQLHVSLDDLLAQLGHLVQIIDLDGNFAQVNANWLYTLGYSEDSVSSLNFFHDVLSESSRDSIRSLVQNLQDSDGCVALLAELVTHDGTYIHVEGSILRQLMNEQAMVVCIFRDITPYRKSESALRKAKDQLQSILDHSGLLISMKDLQGRYQLMNREFAERLGQPVESLVGMTDAELFPPATAAMQHEHDLAMLQDERTHHFEEVLPVIEGLRTFSTTRFPLFTDDGILYAVGSIAEDITQRILTERQSHLRKQAIEHSPSGVSIADARLPDLPLIYINPAFEKKTGYTALEAIGRNCRFLQGDDRDQPGIRRIREAIEAEQPVTEVLRNYRKDGTLFYNELNLAPIHDENGVLTHYVGISTDVTERVLAQQQIQAQNEELRHKNQDLAVARQQAEAIAQLRTQFLATMSHELRTPLNAIIGYTEIQLAGMTGDLTEEQRDYQERVLANADHLLELINDVLDLSKIEAGRMELVSKPFNVSQWLEDIIGQMRGLAEERGLDFTVTLDKNMPEFIVGDPSRIRQMAINLLSNAIKFTNEGSIRVQVQKHGGDLWRFVVEDSGIGIPSHMQETIFEEFRQVDSSSQRKVGGTGLGLAIVRKLCMLMGGNVRLKSRVGVGSTFVITLPLIVPIEEASTV